jgi:hypothetical protein
MGDRSHLSDPRGGPDGLRWFWSLTVNGPMTRADRAATLEEAKAQCRKVGSRVAKMDAQHGAASVDNRQLHHGGGRIIRGAASGLIRGISSGTEAVRVLPQCLQTVKPGLLSSADLAMWRLAMLNHNRCPHNTEAPDVVADIRGTCVFPP